MLRLIGLVKPLSPYMILAITLGLLGHLAATFITVLGGYGILKLLGGSTGEVSGMPGLGMIFGLLIVFAIARGLLRYGEQTCNHYIAFKLLALIRSRIFTALRRLAPAKLEGRDKGDLISVITSDIELLEVFYAHTISPIAIAVLFSGIMVAFIGSWHGALGLLALIAYLIVGLVIPLMISKLSGDDGIRFRTGAGELSGFVLDSM
ncbi:MAG: ABC transporter ATP-binding protein, partial [Firmicutes bacterium]|nr:ABC transporter ATP-binding protein [Bacillota bacterium]